MAPSNVSGSGSNNNSNNGNGNSMRMWLAILVAAASLAFGAGLKVADASADRLIKIENSIDKLSTSVTAGFDESAKDRTEIKIRLGIVESKVNDGR